MRQSEAKLIVVTPDSLPTVLIVGNANKIPIDRILVLDDLDAPLDCLVNNHSHVDDPGRTVDGCPSGIEGSKSHTDLLHHGESDWLHLDSEQALNDTPAIYYPTSGTSGLPKLVVLSHHNLIMQHRSRFLYQQVPYPIVRALCLPLFHVFGAAWLIGSRSATASPPTSCRASASTTMSGISPATVPPRPTSRLPHAAHRAHTEQVCLACHGQ